MTKIAGTDAFRILNRIAGFYQPEPQDEAVAQTYLGTPVFDQLIFPRDGNEAIQLNEDLVINDVLFTITRPKIIVRTPVQGRRGRVKEIISLDDYQIDIVGKIVGQFPLERPVEQLRTLSQIESFEGSVGIAVNFLSLFNIDTIVIDRIRIQEREAYYNEIPFEITASSDEPIELQVTA